MLKYRAISSTKILTLKLTIMNRKCILFVFLLITAVSGIRAQDNSGDSKFYIKINGGYGFLQPGSYRLYSNIIAPAGDVFGSVTESKQGLGSGIRFGGGVGVIASDFLNIGVDVEYLSGATLNSFSSYNSNTGYHTYVDKSVSYTALSVTPHVIFKALSKPDYLIYNKLGILMNLPMDLNLTQHDSSYTLAKPDEDYNSHITQTYKFNLTLGLNVALGVQYRLTDKLRAFGEIFGNYIILSPASSAYKNVASVGKNPPGTDIQNTTYIKNGQTSSTQSGNTTTTVSSVEGNTFNMNAIGINIGIAYRF
jgi:hypothetical protein